MTVSLGKLRRFQLLCKARGQPTLLASVLRSAEGSKWRVRASCVTGPIAKLMQGFQPQVRYHVTGLAARHVQGWQPHAPAAAELPQRYWQAQEVGTCCACTHAALCCVQCKAGGNLQHAC